MTSKINGIDTRPAQLAGNGKSERTDGKSAVVPGASVTAAAHEVKLTGSAVQLAALEKALAQVPDVDMQRVEAARTAIQSGAYQIDSHRIATKLLDLERALAAIETGPKE